MLRTILKEVKEFKFVSLITPVFMILEVRFNEDNSAISVNLSTRKKKKGYLDITMGIKTYSPCTPSRRNMTSLDFAEITKSTPEMYLVCFIKFSVLYKTLKLESTVLFVLTLKFIKLLFISSPF